MDPEQKTNWSNDSIQFPRLIAELEQAGAFTEEMVLKLCLEMDLEADELLELIERAQLQWDRIRASATHVEERHWFDEIEEGVCEVLSASLIRNLMLRQTPDGVAKGRGLQLYEQSPQRHKWHLFCRDGLLVLVSTNPEGVGDARSIEVKRLQNHGRYFPKARKLCFDFSAVGDRKEILQFELAW